MSSCISGHSPRGQQEPSAARATPASSIAFALILRPPCGYTLCQPIHCRLGRRPPAHARSPSAHSGRAGVGSGLQEAGHGFRFGVQTVRLPGPGDRRAAGGRVPTAFALLALTLDQLCAATFLEAEQATTSSDAPDRPDAGRLGARSSLIARGRATRDPPHPQRTRRAWLAVNPRTRRARCVQSTLGHF